jgi:cob(I)alamin adenosyltransferase
MDDKLYTGFGDKGYTRTLRNMRIPKSDSLIELLGTTDELTSALGAAKVWVTDKKLFDDIEKVQRKLIDINGEIAGAKPNVTADCVAYVERMIDEYQSVTGGFSEFVLPGANKASAQLDTARAVARRAERCAVKVGQFGRLSSTLLVYLNRLSDLIYAFARYAEKTNAVQKAVEPMQIQTAGGGAELNLAAAKKIAAAVEEKASIMGKRVVVAVLDGGANLMLLHSMDDAYIASCKIAQDKAYTAVSLKMSTQTALEESRGGALDGLSATTGNGIMLLGGGEPLTAGGKVVGAVGVSGGTAEEDTAFARFAAEFFAGGNTAF